MRRFSSSDPDALFSGRLDPDDVPPELREIAGLIQAARVPGSADELAGEELLVSAIAAEVRRSAPFGAVVSNRRRRLVAQMLSGKVIAAAAAVLLSGGVAAAATGSLPASIQKAVSHGLAHVGISVPAPASHPSPARSGRSAQSKGHGLTKTSTGTDRYGLCTAYLHPTTATSGAKSTSTAFSRLTAAANAKGESVTQYCKGATPTSTTGSNNRGPTHRPTTTPVTTGRPTGKPSHSTPVSVHRQPPKTIPTKAARTATTPARTVHPSGTAHGTATSTPMHATNPAETVRSGGSAKSAPASTSTTTMTLAASVSSTGSPGSNAGKGVSSANSH